MEDGLFLRGAVHNIVFVVTLDYNNGASKVLNLSMVLEKKPHCLEEKKIRQIF